MQGGFFMQYNFQLLSKELISRLFLDLGITDFCTAAQFVRNLDYKRNLWKEDVLCVLKEKGGTCSSKHALLKLLATENKRVEVKLILGIFKMNSNNTPKISKVLEKYSLKEIPEAHNYLKINNQIHDYTRRNSKPEDFLNDLLEEIEIEPSQITTFKIEYHQTFIENYLKENPKIPYSSEEFWQIREACILALQD